MTTTIRPPTLDRVLSVIVYGPVGIGTGTAVAAAAFAPGASARVFVFVLGSGFAVTALVVLLRLPRVAVHLSDDVLRYDGFLLSWTAPRQGVTTVLDNASVEWSDASGRRHRRQIWMLTSAYEDDGTVFARYWRWRRDGLLAVRAWADARAS